MTQEDPLVHLSDLWDSQQVADYCGFSSQSVVTIYLQRGVLPKPILDRGPHRARLWLRQDIETWQRSRMTPENSTRRVRRSQRESWPDPREVN